MFRGLFVFLWNGLSFNFSIIYIIYYRERNWRLGDWEQCAVLQNRAAVCGRPVSLRTFRPSESSHRLAQMHTAAFSYRNKWKNNAWPLSKLEFHKSNCSPILSRLADSAHFPLSFSSLGSDPGPENIAAWAWGCGTQFWVRLKPLLLLASAPTLRPRLLPRTLFCSLPRFSAPYFHLRRRDLLWNLSPQHTRVFSLFLGLILSSLFCESSNWGYAFPGCFPHYLKGTFVINQVHPQKTCEITTNLMTWKGARKQNVTFPKEI